MSDSDSDFGDFEEASFKEKRNPNIDLSLVLDEVVGCSDINISLQNNESYKLRDLLENERPKIIYEQLIELDTYLRPFRWDQSHLKSILLRTLNINESSDSSKQLIKPIDDSLFNQLLQVKDNQDYIPDILKIDPELKLDEEVEPIKLLEEDIIEGNLKHTRDQLVLAINKIMKEIKENDTIKRNLLQDKVIYEDVITNLVGHTQRLRREEIALYNKKQKHKKRFSWVS